MSQTGNFADPASVVLRRRIEWIDTDAFKRALRFNDEVEAALVVTALGRSSVSHELR